MTYNGRKLLQEAIDNDRAVLNEYTSLPNATARQKRRNELVVDFVTKVYKAKDERDNMAAFQEMPFPEAEEDLPVVPIGRGSGRASCPR